MSALLLKALKRTMAGEYSRELSVKVRAGQFRLATLGYKMGGHTPFGLRRQLLDLSGARKQLLSYGERKSIVNDRVTLVPGPLQEFQATFMDRFVLRSTTEIGPHSQSIWIFAQKTRLNELGIGLVVVLLRKLAEGKTHAVSDKLMRERP